MAFYVYFVTHHFSLIVPESGRSIPSLNFLKNAPIKDSGE